MKTYDKNKGKPLNWFNDLTEGEADDLAQAMATPTPEEIEIIKGVGSYVNGNVGNGTNKETIKYLGNTEGSLF